MGCYICGKETIPLKNEPKHKCKICYKPVCPTDAVFSVIVKGYECKPCINKELYV